MARKTQNRRKNKTAEKSAAPASLSRRAMLQKYGLYGLGSLALLGGGGVLAMEFQGALSEADLTAIGRGTPVVVQIHDPQCTLCAALQKETRKALKSFDKDDVLFRVANITSKEGSAFQTRQSLPHVTLVLFDGNGRRQHVVRGVTPAEELIPIFQSALRLRPQS